MSDFIFTYCPRCATVLIEKEIHQVRRLYYATCDSVHYRQPHLITLVVIEYKGKLLLLKRKKEPAKGLWNFCGGYVEYGETVPEAAIREAKEEANVDIQLERLIGIYGGEGGSNIVAAYHAQLLPQQFDHVQAQPEEVSDFGFFAPDNLPTFAFPVHLQIVQDWKKITSSAFLQQYPPYSSI